MPVANESHDYEEINTSYKITQSPVRPAPKPPISNQFNTLGVHGDIEGVPFILNPNLTTDNFQVYMSVDIQLRTYIVE